MSRRPRRMMRRPSRLRRRPRRRHVGRAGSLANRAGRTAAAPDDMSAAPDSTTAAPAETAAAPMNGGRDRATWRPRRTTRRPRRRDDRPADVTTAAPRDVPLRKARSSGSSPSATLVRSTPAPSVPSRRRRWLHRSNLADRPGARPLRPTRPRSQAGQEYLGLNLGLSRSVALCRSRVIDAGIPHVPSRRRRWLHRSNLARPCRTSRRPRRTSRRPRRLRRLPRR